MCLGSAASLVWKLLLPFTYHILAPVKTFLCSFAWEAKCALPKRYFHKHFSAVSFDHHHFVASALAAAAPLDSLAAAAAAHARLVKLHVTSTSLWNKLLALYSRCGHPHLARKMFDAMPERDAVSYNTVLSCLSRAGRGAAACARVYARMLADDCVTPSHITLSALFGATSCRRLVAQLHAHSVRLGLDNDAFVGGALVGAYGRCGDVDEAVGAFETITAPDAVSWNVMIDVCARIGSKWHAMEVLTRMRKEHGESVDCFTLTSILKTCSEKADLCLGMQLHASAWKVGLESEVPASNALITMYLKCGGGMNAAVRVFKQISEPNIISWTAMIAGLAQNGLAEEAAVFYKEMVRAGETENEFCFASLLPALGALVSLEHGRMAHCRIVKSVFWSDTMVGNALINMYFKCGSSGDAHSVFKTMTRHDAVSWTVMILGYGQHGEGERAVEIFREMIVRGLTPDSITFLAALSACSHGGLIDEGLAIFRSMVDNHNVKPRREHCACLVDLLGRAGQLNEAEMLIGKMGMEANSSAWESLLGACGIHGDVELGNKLAEKIMTLDPCKDGPYVLLSNMYAEQSRWQEKEKVRESLDSRRLRKETARSWSSALEF